MNGLINVTVDGRETFYQPTCACGWSGVITSIVELSELALLSHFDRDHRSAAA